MSNLSVNGHWYWHDISFRNLPKSLNFMGSQASKIVRVSKMASSVSSAEVQQLIKDAIAKDKVVIFSKSYCPYCNLAKEVSIDII